MNNLTVYANINRTVKKESRTVTQNNNIYCKNDNVIAKNQFDKVYFRQPVVIRVLIK